MANTENLLNEIILNQDLEQRKIISLEEDNNLEEMEMVFITKSCLLDLVNTPDIKITNH